MSETEFAKRARASDPLTSHLAAERVQEFGCAHQAKIVGSLIAHGPGTIYELAERTGLDHVAVARRMHELEELKAARPTDQTRIGPKGRPCRVWEAA